MVVLQGVIAVTKKPRRSTLFLLAWQDWKTENVCQGAGSFLLLFLAGWGFGVAISQSFRRQSEVDWPTRLSRAVKTPGRIGAMT